MIARRATPDDRLRMLRDCGVAVGPANCPAFRKLTQAGLADWRPCITPGQVRTAYFLTDLGQAAATTLGPFE